MPERHAGRRTANVFVVAGGVLAAVSLFLPWYGAASIAQSVATIGIHTNYGALASALFIVSAALAVFGWNKRNTSSAVLATSSVGSVILLVRWATLPMGSAVFGGVSLYSYGPRYGLWLTLAAGIVQVVAMTVVLWRATGRELTQQQQKQQHEQQQKEKAEIPEGSLPAGQAS